MTKQNINPFLFRHNDKKYYITITITISVLILLIVVIGLFTPYTATVKLPLEPSRVLWPAEVDENGSSTSRKIINTATYGTNTSLMVFDPWSFTHVTHGILFFFILFIIKIIVQKVYNFSIPITTIFILTLIIEFLWEYIENSSFVINKYRSYNEFKNYFGDSIVNSLGDIICCLLGFLLVSISPAAAIGYVGISEILLWPHGFTSAFMDIF